MQFTLGQAAAEVGRNKSTLSRDISKGRLSAERQQDGSYLIDAAELFRVYEKRNIGNTDNPVAATGTATDDSSVADSVAVLQAKLQMLLQSNEDKERQLQDKERQIDDLRQDRDHWRQQATYLLEDKRKESQEKIQDEASSKKWWKLW